MKGKHVALGVIAAIVLIVILILAPINKQDKNTTFDEGTTTYFHIDNTLPQVDSDSLIFINPDTLQKYITGSQLCFVDTLEDFPNSDVDFHYNKNGITDSITIELKDSVVYNKSFKNIDEDIVALWNAIQIIHGRYGY